MDNRYIVSNLVRTIHFALPTDRDSWNTIVTHPLQSWDWGEFRKAMGIDVARLARTSNSKLVDGWQITFHNIPRTSYTIGYFPKGPKPSNEMIRELTVLGKQKNAIFIQLEPNIRIDSKLHVQSPMLIPSHHPLFTRYTFILDLTKSEEELLKSMHSKTRYNLNLARRHNVEIKEDNSQQAFESYLQLNKETTNRQGFYAHNARYQQHMWEIMRQADIAHLFTASYQGSVLAAWIVFVWKDTLFYPYGASSREHREVMAPHLLLWEIVSWAKKKKLKSFDLWGALGPNPDVKDPWYGFHRFKEGFHPELVEFIGSYDLIIKPYHYELFKIADRIRWAILNNRKHS